LNLRRKLLFICFVNISGYLFDFLEVVLGFGASFGFVFIFNFFFFFENQEMQLNQKEIRRLVWLCSHAFFTLSDRLFIGLKKKKKTHAGPPEKGPQFVMLFGLFYSYIHFHSSCVMNLF